MSEKIYAWLLKLYPAGFRRDYGPSAMQLFRDRLQAERGFSRRLRFWLDVIADLAVSFPREHWRQNPVHPAAGGYCLSAEAVTPTKSDRLRRARAKGMFAKYVEQSRRAIFYARYEASQTGSRLIEPEHLLLGILRTDDQLALRLLKTKENIESIGQQIHKTFPPRKNVSISVNLRLSVECKRMLANGAEEAERRNAGHIEPQHLLLGLLREEKCAAAKIMLEHGVPLSLLENKAD